MSCSKRVDVLPSDYEIYDNKKFPCIPDGYYVISKTKYDQENEQLYLCREAILMLGQ